MSTVEIVGALEIVSTLEIVGTLEVRSVSLTFDSSDGETIQALDRLDLDVEEGETLALLGPSGCGKSSLLRVVAGIQRPDEGTVSWAGEDLTSVQPEQRDFGLMFQDHALFPHRSVGENIEFGPKMRGDDANTRREIADRMLTLVDLGGFRTRSVDTLSGGEAQRVALARALAPSPRLLMLDEPLGSLDRALRDRLAVDLRAILKELGQTAIHVTHDQDEAFAVADRVAVMKGGRVERIGTPLELWHDPQTQFVAEFLGHPNIVDGSILGLRPGPVVIRTETLLAAESRPAEAHGAAVELAGQVVGQQFRGDHFRITFITDSGVELVALTHEQTAPGSAVRFVVDPAAVAQLSTD